MTQTVFCVLCSASVARTTARAFRYQKGRGTSSVMRHWVSSSAVSPSSLLTLRRLYLSTRGHHGATTTSLMAGCTKQQVSPWTSVKLRATATSDARQSGNVFTAPRTPSSVSSTILTSRINLVKLSMKLHWPIGSTGSMTRVRPDGSKPLHAEST